MASSADSSQNPSVISTAAVRIGMVVGEQSGDILGADLIIALKKLFPNAVFEGVGGPLMLEQGFESLFNQERLAVMGLVEPLKRLPELLSIRKSLKKHFIENPPAIFIGIDAPDFNLGLEESLRFAGIKTAHYVSPSVWAWRQNRIKKIARAVDLMLTLFPFEAAFYQQRQVPVKFVGHPLADQLPIEADRQSAINKLQLPSEYSSKRIIALLPGSRQSEVERLGTLFIQAAKLCQKTVNDVAFLVPSANSARHQQLESLIEEHAKGIPILLIAGQSREVMAASDVVLMASGTASLEAMLLKKPMIIAYKMAALSYWIIRKMVKVRYVGLPNLLANKPLVEEYLQKNATPENLAKALAGFLTSRERKTLVDAFTHLHLALKKDASAQAALALVPLIETSL